MTRTPLIRRLVAIAVAALIPFGAAASSAHAATPTEPSAPVVVSAPSGDDGAGFVMGCFRSSWS